MEFLERYLQAVSKYLPLRRRDDIVAELRANMESQVEDRESELGRLLNDGEMEDLLRKMGPPVVVASRYQPQQYLIGPTIFPVYLYILRAALLWAFIVCIILSAVVYPLTMNEPARVLDSLFQIPAVLVQVAGWVTLVFAAFEFFSARYPQMRMPLDGITCRWDPRTLPPLDKDDTRQRKPRSMAQAIAEIFFGSLFLAWLLLIPAHPFLLLGPGVAYLKVTPYQLAPFWWAFYWCVVATNIFQIAWKCFDMLRETWQFPDRLQQIAFKIVGLVPIIVVLTAPGHIYVSLKNPELDQLRYGQNLDQINNSIHLGFAVICSIIVLTLAIDLGRWAFETYRRHESGR